MLGVIEPGVRKALVTRNKKVGIIATSSTVKSGKYAKKIQQLNKHIDVTSQPALYLCLWSKKVGLTTPSLIRWPGNI